MGTGNKWVWIGQSHATGDYNLGVTGTVWGQEGFVTIKNCWNNKDNWVSEYHIGEGPGEEPCSGNPTGGDDTGRGGYYYLSATGYPGEWACQGAPSAKFKRLPHNPQAGLCDGPYPKSECLYGGAGTGGHYGHDQIGSGCSVPRHHELYAIRAEPSYFDANLFPNMTKPCTGAPLERLRLGDHLQESIKYTQTTPDLETNPYGQGYHFRGLNLRAMHVWVDMQGEIRETNRDQSRCILADPQNQAFNFKVWGQGDFYGNATRYLSGGEQNLGNGTLRGNGVEILHLYPCEYGEDPYGVSGWTAKCNYNKSMTIQWIGTIRGACRLRGTQVERALIKPSPEFDQRFVHYGHATGATGWFYPASMEFRPTNVYTGPVPEWDGPAVGNASLHPIESHFHAKGTYFFAHRNDCKEKGAWPYHIVASEINGNTGYIFNTIKGSAAIGGNVESKNSIEEHGLKFHSDGEVYITGSGEKTFERVDIINSMEMEAGHFAFGGLNSQVFIRGGTIEGASTINMDSNEDGMVEIMGMATGGNDSQWRDAEPEKGLLMVQNEDNPGIIGIPKGSYMAFRGPTGYQFRGMNNDTPFFDTSSGGK